MSTKRILNAAFCRKLLAILLIGLASFCVVLVWSASAQDDTPAYPSRPTQEQPIAQTQEPQTDQRQTPVLTIAPMTSQKIGQSVVASATLVNTQGVVQANKPLLIFIDGKPFRRDRTDQNGVSSISLGPNLPLGDHQLQVQFIGTAAYYGVTATTTFRIVPLQLTLETVPPLAGIPIAVNGQVAKTDSKGLLVIDVGAPSAVNLEVLQKADANIDDHTRATFVRWSDEGFQAKRTVDIANDAHLQIGLSVSHPIVHNFVDLSGTPVDYSKISSMQVRTSTGTLVSFNDSQPKWITSTEIARRRTGLEATNILYSVESVTIDGTNVVNRYQQHFLADGDTPWQIQLLLYSVTVNANDSLFGFPVGTGISLEYPDGHVKSFPLGANKSISLETLARGTYRIKVDGVQSVTGWTPIALSRDQSVQLQVFSYLDVAAILIVGVLIALAMLFYGRPFLMKLPVLVYRRLHKRSQTQPVALAGETGSFNITFFHSSAIDNTLSPASVPRKAAIYSQRDGNVLQISGVEGAFTRPILVNFPLGSLICIVNGRSKREQLLVDLLQQWHTELTRRSTTEGANERRVRNRESIFADICSIYASLPESRRNRYKAKHFDFRSKDGQCKNCEGKGHLPGRTEEEDSIVCPVCNGKGYKSSILKIKLNGQSISDVLTMTISEGVDFFVNYPTVADKLQRLQQLGFGNLRLSEPGIVLSTKGILNIKEIIRHIDHNLYLFNAPLGKMSPINAVRQVTTLAELLDRGSIVRIIEDDAAPRVIENPVVMLKLGVEHTRGTTEDRASAPDEKPILGLNG